MQIRVRFDWRNGKQAGCLGGWTSLADSNRHGRAAGNGEVRRASDFPRFEAAALVDVWRADKITSGPLRVTAIGPAVSAVSMERSILNRAVNSFEPAESLRLMVAPAFAPVAGTSPPWVSNTGHDLFRRATGALV